MSLRKVSSWRIEASGWFWSPRRRFYFTTRGFFEMSYETYQQMRDNLAKIGVVNVGIDADRKLWWTKAGVFWADSGLSAEEVMLLVWDRQRRQDAKLDHLRREAEVAPRRD